MFVIVKILDKIFLSTNTWWYRIIWNSNTRNTTLFVLRHLPIKRNRAIFFNRTCGPFECNPAYIVDEIVTRLNKKTAIEPWFVVSDLFNAASQQIPQGCRLVEYQQLNYYYIFNTSKFIVVNVVQKLALNKRSSQKVIQTGHGGHGIKKFYFDNIRISQSVENEKFIKEISNFDLLLSDSTFWSSVLRTAYRYKGEILEKGFPRNRAFFEKTIEKNSASEKKYLIYTPTFRLDNCREVYGFDIDGVVNALETRFGGIWYIRVSAHPLMKSFYRELYDFTHPRLIDVGMEDLMPLLKTSDALITDYSSAEMDFCMRDVANINDAERHAHPIFQLFRDLVKYENELYIDPRNLPFPYAEDDQQLIKNILGFDEVAYLQRLDAFHKEIGLKETGNAAKNVVDWMETVVG